MYFFPIASFPVPRDHCREKVGYRIVCISSYFKFPFIIILLSQVSFLPTFELIPDIRHTSYSPPVSRV